MYINLTRNAATYETYTLLDADLPIWGDRSSQSMLETSISSTPCVRLVSLA